jgi:hypothetical protein
MEKAASWRNLRIMLFRSGKNWAVDFFLHRGWLIKRRPRIRPRPASWNPLSTVPAECLEQRVLLSIITVTSTADSGNGSLRDAIASAANGDEIEFAAATDGTPIVLSSGELTINQSLTITGNGAANTIIDAAQSSRIFSISSSAGNVTFDSLTLENGQTTDVGMLLGGSGDGGAILSISTGVLTIQNSTLSGNSTAGDQAQGGAVYDGSGTVALTNSTLTGNYTLGQDAFGGAIYDQSGSVTITNSTLSENSTQGQSAMGGAIFSSFGTVDVTNSTLTGNSAAGSFSYAGAIGTRAGSITAINSTIVQNDAAVGGGIATFNSMAALTLTNTILARNTDSGTAPDLYQRNPSTLTLTNNLIGDNAGTSLTAAPVGSPDSNGNLIGTAAALINPRLGPLNFNGGPTPTMSLLANSPAIDAGTNTDPAVALLSTDQRGTPFVRRFGTAVDMGAYEVQTQALDLVVTSADDTLDAGYNPAHLTLRDAVALADGNAGLDAITFDPALNGTPIVVTGGQMVISETVTITGNGAANTIIDAAQNSRIFSMTSTAGDVTLASLTLENGKTTANSASGGAIRDVSTGTLSILNSIVSGNSTTGDGATGGAISDNNGTIAILNSTFSGNSTSGDGAYGGAIGSQFGHLTVTDSTLSGNHTTGLGAGGGAIAAAYVTVTDSTLTANDTNDDYASGGAITALHDVTITNSSLTGNSTGGHLATGGAIDSIFGAVTVTASNLSGNFTAGTLADGGAIYDQYGTVALYETTLAGNYTMANGARGGAISSGGTSVTVTNSTLSGNSTAGVGAIGGAIAAYGAVLVTNSTLSGNSTAGLLATGGAIYSAQGAVTVTDSTIARNQAAHAEGGGIYVDDSAATVTLTNSILAQNTDNGTAPDLDVAPVATLVVAFSLIGNNTGNSLAPAPVGSPDGHGNLIGTTGAVIDPLLGALANNGGPTQTMALLAGSPALNAGDSLDAVDPNTSDPLTTDQRGAPFARVSGTAVDMGAYEAQALSLVVTSADDALDPVFDLAHVTLRDALALANANPGADSISFDSAINGTPIDLTLGELTISDDVTITGNGEIHTTIDAQLNSRVLHVQSGVTASLSGLTITGGSVGTGFGIAGVGGGIVNQGALTISDSVITGNAAGNDGGGICSYSATSLSLSNCTIGNNTAAAGAGIYSAGSGTFSATNCTITGNIASSVGGGLAGDVVTESLVNCTIDGNSAPRGAGIYATGGTWTIKASTVSNNQAGTSGGGIQSQQANLIVINSTVSGNTAPTGGGLFFGIPGATYNSELTDVTISNNRATTGTTAGGGVFVRVGDGSTTFTQLLTLQNTIVAGNFGGATGSTAADVAGPLVAASSFNIVGDGSNMTGISNGSGNNRVGTLASPINAHLGLLANNGGPTRTMALLASSPAAGAGAIFDAPGSIPITVDQRGKTRFTGGVDIGAYQTVTVGSITRKTPATSPTNASSVTFTVTFNVPVLNVGTAFAVNAGSIGSVTPESSTVYDVTVTGLGGFTGTLTLSFATGQTVTDGVGTRLVNTIPTGTNTNTYVLDHVAPITTSFVRETPALFATNATALVFRATFSKAVTAVDTTDFNAHGATTATVTNVTPVGGSGGTQYDVTVSGGNLAGFNGVVGLDLKIGQNITDLVGNPLPFTEPAIDQTYTVDHLPPASFAFAGEYAVATMGSGTLTLASIAQSGANLTLNGSSVVAGVVITPTRFNVGGTTANYGDSVITFGSTGPFANQVWTKLDLPADYTNQGGAAVHIMQTGAALTFVNKLGQTSAGHWISPTQFIATDWGNEIGTVGNGIISWSVGVVWSENLALTGTQNGSGTTSITATPSPIYVSDYLNPGHLPVHLVQTGTNNVVVIDATGHMSLGSFINSTQFSTSFFPGQVATISGLGDTITWSGGIIWTQTARTSAITLTDYTNQFGVPVHLIQNGTNQLAFVDALGRTALGTINGTTVQNPIFAAGVTGTLSANSIVWSNNFVWTKTNAVPLLIALTDTNGSVSHVKLTSATTMIGLDGTLLGLTAVRLNGKLFWSNGQVWQNFDPDALNALFEMGSGYP